MIEASSRSWVQIKALEAVAERLPSQLRGETALWKLGRIRKVLPLVLPYEEEKE